MRIELPSRLAQVHEMLIPIRWGDMDAMGHVNNASYFRYMETARIEWFRVANCMVDPAGQGPVIVNAFCNFQRQFEYPGEIRIRTYVGEVGRSSFDSFHVMTLADDPAQTPCASGGATVVWVDFPAQRSLPLPAHLRDYLAGLGAA
ncbi:MAG: thioesterase family protein [Tibeticola sp.]